MPWKSVLFSLPFIKGHSKWWAVICPLKNLNTRVKHHKVRKPFMADIPALIIQDFYCQSIILLKTNRLTTGLRLFLQDG